MTAAIHWRVHLHPEVIRYLFQLRWEGESVRQAIATLVKEGPPSDASELKEKGFYLWVEAKHWITFRIEEEQRAIYVTVVEPIG